MSTDIDFKANFIANITSQLASWKAIKAEQDAAPPTIGGQMWLVTDRGLALAAGAPVRGVHTTVSLAHNAVGARMFTKQDAEEFASRSETFMAVHWRDLPKMKIEILEATMRGMGI